MSAIIQRNFSGGELTPSLYARVDTSRYQTGLRVCRNAFVMRHGGLSNRPGTQFVGEVKDSTKAVRLVKFVFNNEQTYVLEFGDLYFRIIQDGAHLTDLTLTITGVSQANPGVVTYTGTDPVNGDEVYISGIVGPIGAYLNNRNFKVANVNGGANTFELQTMDGVNYDTSGLGLYTSGGTAARIYTVTTPYVEADLMDLKYVQSADVLTIAHPNYAPREVARVAATNWTINTVSFAPSISAPTGVAVSGVAGTVAYWVVTAVMEDTYEESIASSAVGANSVPTSGAPRTVSWNTVTGAVEYNVYRAQNGVYGFIGVAVGLSFVDTGFTPDVNDTPPVARNPFNATDDYPSAVSYIQQRLAFANTNNDPEKCWLSRTGFFNNFTISSPLQDDDAVTFTLAGRQVNEVKHLIDIGKLVIFTAAGEWSVEGDSAGVIRPTDVNPKQHSYNGASDLAPIVLSGNALYVQARGSVVRDLGFDYQIDGYRGNDLSLFSSHLFDGYTLVDWDYQQIPNSIVWAVRSDGKLLGLTYVREQQILGWHRHDTEGTFENVCTVPEGDEDAVYYVINRTVDGRTVRYIERMYTRFVDDIDDSVFVDSALTYDGRNTSATTMKITNGTTWSSDEVMQVQASASYFTTADVGNEIHLTYADGTEIRFRITGYTSATVMNGRPSQNVAAAYQDTTTTTWAKAVDEVSGLWHLEDKDVSIFADGFVVANPNNTDYTVRTVTNGAITLDRPYAVIHVGLPYTTDVETLDIDTAERETLVNKKKRVAGVTMQFEKTRGIFAGLGEPESDSSFENFYELKIRSEEGYNDPVDLLTGTGEIIVRPEWNSNGRVWIRQTDPLPMTLLSVVPEGDFPIM